MASSCTLRVDGYQGRYMELVCQQTSQDAGSNTSTITWTLTVGGGTSNNYSTLETIVEIDDQEAYYNGGASYSSGKFPASRGSKSGTVTVKHNSDGQKTIKVYLQTSIYTSDKLIDEASWTLEPNIRDASISANQTFTMGSSGGITITSDASDFRYTVEYLWGDTTTEGINAGKGYKGTIVSRTSSKSISWTPPLELANAIPNDVSGVGSLVCYSYSGWSLVSTSTTTFRADVPSSIVPSVTSFIAERVNNDVPDDWGLYIQGKSQCKLTAVGAGSYKSTISSYTIKNKIGGGVISSMEEGTTGVLNESGDVSFIVTVTDSRGRTASKDVTITVTPYSLPSVSSILSQRSDASGKVDDNGTYIRTSCECLISSCEGKNSLTSCKVSYRQSGDYSWSSEQAYTSGSVVILAGNADIDLSYEVKYEISDALSTVTFIDMVSTSFTTLDFKKGGKGFAVGKASEKDAFECAMDAEFTGKFSADLSDLIVMESFTADRLTVNSNATVDAYLDITKEGYKALGVIGVHTSHGSALLVVAHLSAPTTAKVTVRNVSSSSVTVAPSADILYLKII